ncbi:MAG: adenylate/guanylate cyclase domain-containing protein, partial [Methylobacteriaceae bacterium]|nr:adenylate/guanylate cyclase domain-containing protein [Methylobacteriaceae bacterium]
LHSEYSGVARIWTKENGSSFRLFPHESRDEAYLVSPFHYVHQVKEWLVMDVDATPDERFGVVPDLKEAGYKQYVVVPVLFTNGSENGITFATYTKDGFDARALAILRFLMPKLAAALEIRAVNQRLNSVLRIYVGEEPHRAILSGAIRRGQVSRIRSAILFADMRGYTRLSSELSPEEAVELLDNYFDCLVPPIEQEGGEVLKYMGDGLLAIFRDRADDTGGAAQSALDAAVRGLVRIEAANQDDRFPTRIKAGISLHYGEAAYGNVGSGVRLDFTVIGPDVNLASRIARLNKLLDEPLLMSRAFVERLWGDPEYLGAHALDGIPDPVPIYRLRAEPPPPATPRLEPSLELTA